MRRQDELIALYQGRGRYAQKYLLSQMGRLALAFDSEELLEFLQGQIGSPDPVVASQALFSLLEFLPAYVHKRYALKESTAGVWTQLMLDPAETQALLARAERMVRAGDGLVQAAQLTLKPLADALLAQLGHASGWTRTATLVTLAQFDLRGVRAHLEGELARGAHDLVLARAVRRVSAADGPDRIVELVRREGPSNPDLYLLLCGLPADRVLPVVMDAAARTDTVGRMNLAQALGTLRGADLDEPYGALAKAGEGWVIVALLDAIEQSGNPLGLDRLIAVFRAMNDDFVRVQCVRAAGGLPGGAAKDFALAAVRGGSDLVRAAALETLARQGVEPGDVAQAARGLLQSPQLKARVNAILAFLEPGQVLEHASFSELIMSEDPLHRLEAAYVLGYLQSPRAVGLLTALAGLDPSPSVRQQAAKSLSRYGVAEAMPHLLQMIQGAQPRHALTAARALTRYAGADAAAACDAIVGALETTTVPIERALLYRALGAVAQRQRLESARGALAAGLGESDPLILSGVLEGWNLVGAAQESMVMGAFRKLASLTEPRLRARALMALWSAGDVDALDGLAKMIASGDAKSAAPALECALEVGLLLPDALTENRFPALAERLLDLAEQPELAVQAAEELIAAPAREERRDTSFIGDAFSVRRSGEQVVYTTTPVSAYDPGGAQAQAPAPEPAYVPPAEPAYAPPAPPEYAPPAEPAYAPAAQPEYAPPAEPAYAPPAPPAYAPPPEPEYAPPAPPAYAPPPEPEYAPPAPPEYAPPAESEYAPPPEPEHALAVDPAYAPPAPLAGPDPAPTVRAPVDDAESLITSVLSTQSRVAVVAPAEPAHAAAPEPLPPAPAPAPPAPAPRAPAPAPARSLAERPEPPPTLVGVVAPNAEPAPEAARGRSRPTQRVAVKPRVTSSFRVPVEVQGATATSGTVDRLKAFLTGLEGEQKGSIAESLARATYLITDRVAGPAAASPARKIAIGAGLGTLIVGVVVLALSMKPAPEMAKTIGPLWVESVDGAAQDSHGKALGENTPIKPGESMKTGPQSVLTLVTPAGGKVIAQPNSSFVYVGLESAGTGGVQRYCFKDASGEVNFDFRNGGDVEFRSGPRRVRATRAHLLVARDRRAPSLTVVSGTGYLSHDKGGEVIILRSGDTIGLE